ncbi:MAG: alpha/beta fold hydrolase [Candidatus Velamenicoccus archaeovorus]
MRRPVAVLATVALIALGFQAVASASPATTGRSGSATVASVGTIAWGRCDDPSLRQAHARCAMLDVPLDHADPTGTQIQLALSRIKHTVPDDQYQGVMLVNPGGPGGSGLGLVTLGQYVPNGAGDAYDWIGFDPRGVGSSVPSLSCIPKYFHGDRPPYPPTSQTILDTWLSRSERYADACAANGAELLPHLTTIDAARDMDGIRQALGADQINYYGFSYGTYLGQVYATLFPGKLRRAVFDSNVDPRAVWYQANFDQDIAFQTNIEIWFDWVAQYRNVYHLGRTGNAVERRYYDVWAALKRHPAGGIVGPSEWDDIFLFAGYYQFLWTYLGGVFSDYVHHDAVKRLINAYRSFDGPGNDNGFAMYLATECTDAPWPTDVQTFLDDNAAVDEQAPFFTWGNAWFNAPCVFWSVPAGTPVTVTGDATPVLLIDETLDAATPFTGSLYVRSVFLNSVLLAEPGGTTHAGSLFGNECVDGAIADYLADGTLPPRQSGAGPDLECDPLPPPVPGALGAAGRPGPGLQARLVPVMGH